MPPAVRNILDQVQTEPAWIWVIEGRLRDVHTGCHRPLLHRNRDGVFADLDGDADGIDAFAKPGVTDSVGDDFRQSELDVIRPLAELQRAEFGDSGAYLGGSCRTRDDFDLAFDGVSSSIPHVVCTQRLSP